MANPPLNPPSFRYPFNLPDNTDPEVKKALETVYNGLVVHEQAFRQLKSQLTGTQTTVEEIQGGSSSTSTGVTSFNTRVGNVSYFPQLGMVNDQLGNPAYLTQVSDNGAKIIVGDSTAVAITLNASVGTPWFTIIDNDSSAVANLTTTSGSVFGATSIPSGGFGIVFFDGTNFWCGATGSGGTCCFANRWSNIFSGG